MSENHTTIADKLKSSGIDPESVNIYQLSEDLRYNGATISGYTTSNNGEAINLLYDNSEALDSALERCGVSLPEKVIEPAVEGKKGRGRKVEKDDGDSQLSTIF